VRKRGESLRSTTKADDENKRWGALGVGNRRFGREGSDALSVARTDVDKVGRSRWDSVGEEVEEMGECWEEKDEGKRRESLFVVITMSACQYRSLREARGKNAP
jgi:hypothetical protein